MPNELTIPEEKGTIEIIPFGTDERIKLNVGIVQKMIAVPTKLGQIPDAVQCMKFMMLCKARHLNPFEGDAYLIGYDTHSGPNFSLITAHQVFLKRAEASASFDGMESGVVVSSAGEDASYDGVTEREGDLVYEGEKLIGGWAKVYRKDIGRPIYRRLKLSTFNTGRSRWAVDPAGMIVKCTEADALRTAFPTHLGGLYMKEELEPLDITPKAPPVAIRFEAEPETVTEGVRVVDGAFEQGEEKPKRKRRTKAEMQAAKESENVSSAVAVGGNEQPEGSGIESETDGKTETSRENKAAPAPDNTPLVNLQLLIESSPVSEAQFTRHLVSKMIIEPHQKLIHIDDARLNALAEGFKELANEILDAQEKAPY